jgi:hypothetical protein
MTTHTVEVEVDLDDFDPDDLKLYVERMGYLLINDDELSSINAMSAREPIETTHQLERLVPKLRDFCEAMRKAIAK